MELTSSNTYVDPSSGAILVKQRKPEPRRIVELRKQVHDLQRQIDDMEITLSAVMKELIELKSMLGGEHNER